MKKFTLKTMDGCKRILAICLVLIFLGALFARLIETDFGKIKINEFNIDARGATLNGEIFYPAGTSSDDKLPAVLVMHGTGCTYGVMRHFSVEMARRGFVSLAVSCYGAGISEQPLYDELGHGEDIGNGFDYGNTTSGFLDAVNFTRSLDFVDPTRIGISGHSMGARISQCTAMTDCGYETLNDRLINILYNEFGQTFTEEEIYQDANELAKERLNADQLAYYEYLAAETTEYYNTRIKAALPLGNALTALINQIGTANVAGYEVQRNCQVNLGVVNGALDYAAVDGVLHDPISKESWHTGEEDIQVNQWYVMDDQNGTSEIIGDFDTLSIATDSALADAIENRTAKVALVNMETHSKNFFSKKTTADLITFFEQTLDYSNGRISEGAVPMGSDNQVWHIARCGNLLAFFGMLFMIFPLLGMLASLKFYQPAIGAVDVPQNGKVNKKQYWIFTAATVVFTVLVTYYANTKLNVVNSPYFNLTRLCGATIYFIVGLALFCAIMLAGKIWLNKKAGNGLGIAHLNLNIGIKGIFASIIMASVLIAACYTALMSCKYLFKEDFRFWMFMVTEMKVEYWFIMLKYTIIFIIPYLIIGANVNYSFRTDMPEWKEDLLCVFFASVGVWALCLFSYLNSALNPNVTALFSNFIVSYQLNFWVPVTTYILRKMYRMTKNLWPGAIFCSLIISWSMASEIGAHTYYIGQGLWSVIFNV